MAKVQDCTIIFRISFKRKLYQFNACILNNFCTRVASAWKVQYLVLHVDRHAFDSACIVFNNCPIFRLDDEDLWCASSLVTGGAGFKDGSQSQKQEKSTTNPEGWKLALCEVTWARNKTRKQRWMARPINWILRPEFGVADLPQRKCNLPMSAPMPCSPLSCRRSTLL